MDAPRSRADGDSRPTVAIFRSPLFNPSETFVRDHGAGLRGFRPLFVGLSRKSGRVDAPMVVAGGPGERLGLTLLGRGRPLAARLATEDVALVHAHFGTDGLLALPIAERLGVPLVVTLHGFDVSRGRSALLLSGRLSWMRYAVARQRLFRGAAQFLAVSDAVRRRALALGFPEERLATHRLGVDLDRFAPAVEGPEPGLILHVGRLVEKKGTRLLIEAIGELAASAPAARLVVIGDGPLRPRLERRAAALGLGTRVTFLGALPRDEVVSWMRRAWLLAVPSLTAWDGDSEGLPMVLCEAAATGLPVVATRHSGIPEAVLDGETGLLVPEGRADPLAASLAALLADPSRRARMAAAARALAERRFDARRQSARLEERYAALLAARSRRCA